MRVKSWRWLNRPSLSWIRWTGSRLQGKVIKHPVFIKVLLLVHGCKAQSQQRNWMLLLKWSWIIVEKIYIFLVLTNLYLHVWLLFLWPVFFALAARAAASAGHESSSWRGGAPASVTLGLRHHVCLLLGACCCHLCSAHPLILPCDLSTTPILPLAATPSHSASQWPAAASGVRTLVLKCNMGQPPELWPPQPVPLAMNVGVRVCCLLQCSGSCSQQLN